MKVASAEDKEWLSIARPVAEAICHPHKPPFRLVWFLAKYAIPEMRLAQFIKHGGKAPAPSMVRGDLKHVAVLARRLAAALEPAEIGLALARVEPHEEGLYDALLALPGQRQPKVAQDLVALAERTERAADQRNIPGKSMASRLLVAMIVVECWLAVHGRVPGDQNKHALDACGRLWAAAGGIEGPDDPDWRASLRDAKATPYSQDLGREATSQQRQEASWRQRIRSEIASIMGRRP